MDLRIDRADLLLLSKKKAWWVSGDGLGWETVLFNDEGWDPDNPKLFEYPILIPSNMILWSK